MLLKPKISICCSSDIAGFCLHLPVAPRLRKDRLISQKGDLLQATLIPFWAGFKYFLLMSGDRIRVWSGGGENYGKTRQEALAMPGVAANGAEMIHFTKLKKGRKKISITSHLRRWRTSRHLEHCAE